MNTVTHTAELVREYRKARKLKPFMRYGQDAVSSLDAARTILRFRELEDAGAVRIRSEHQSENYFDIFGEPDTDKERKEIIDSIDRNGLHWVTSEVCSRCEECEDEQWEHADSVGMCIYSDPCDPYENSYVVDLMKAAIEQAERK